MSLSRNLSFAIAKKMFYPHIMMIRGSFLSWEVCVVSAVAKNYAYIFKSVNGKKTEIPVVSRDILAQHKKDVEKYRGKTVGRKN